MGQQMASPRWKIIGQEDVWRVRKLAKLTTAQPIFPVLKPVMCHTLLGAGATGSKPQGGLRLLPLVPSLGQWVQRAYRCLSQPDQASSQSLAVLFVLIRSRHALVNRLLRSKYKCHSLGDRLKLSTQTTDHSSLPFSITGSLRLQTHKSAMHPFPHLGSPP